MDESSRRTMTIEVPIPEKQAAARRLYALLREFRDGIEREQKDFRTNRALIRMDQVLLVLESVGE